ncbi:MAG TPA: MgtC/SapB family protein [Gaiellales bacterium]|jgi:putative Mg2+ transporter-C (MgtC) family protein|nr:MgtC/SapB family protein [Gaiellales bacterium]
MTTLTAGLVPVIGSAFSQRGGQGWEQGADLALAFLLASAIGLERESRQRSAGLRTYTLVGFGAALFMLVSKYGFADVLVPRTVVLDPSRIAAQIVTGIGFIGGGLIFVRRDAVRGLTTAAAVWLTAAIGMACGAGLPLLGVAGTAGYMIVVFAYTPLVHRLPGARATLTQLRLEYADGQGVLRHALEVSGRRGFTVGDLAISRAEDGSESRGRDQRRDRSEAAIPAVVQVTMTVEGTAAVNELVASLGDLDGVVAVSAGDLDRE